MIASFCHQLRLILRKDIIYALNVLIAKLCRLLNVYTVCHSAEIFNPDPAEPRYALTLQTV